MAWRDAALHVPMGFAFAAVIALPFAALTPLTFWQAAPPACVVAALAVWLREATQWQEDAQPRPSWKFLRGWRETALTAETLVPIAALLIAGVMLI